MAKRIDVGSIACYFQSLSDPHTGYGQPDAADSGILNADYVTPRAFPRSRRLPKRRLAG